MNSRHSQRPSAEEFFQFFFACRSVVTLSPGDDPLQSAELMRHRVYTWMHSQEAYRKAERRFRESGYFRACCGDDIEVLGFAMLVALSFWHYVLEKQSALWKGAGTNRKRNAAAGAFTAALRWIRDGFGPHSQEDRRKLAELLGDARSTVLGRDVPNAYRVRAGGHRPAAVLIRELASSFHTSYGECFPSIICDLVLIVEPSGVSTRTIERNIKSLKPHLANPTDQ